VPGEASIRHGRRALEKALGEDPSSAEAWLELGRLELAEAALRPAGAAAALGRASKAVAEAKRLWPERPDVELALAALEDRRARLGDQGAGERAREHLQRALELRAKLSDEPVPAGWRAGATLEGQLGWLP